jgi:hypothetical protein
MTGPASVLTFGTFQQRTEGTGYPAGMSTVTEIKQAVSKLPQRKTLALVQWLHAQVDDRLGDQERMAIAAQGVRGRWTSGKQPMPNGKDVRLGPAHPARRTSGIGNWDQPRHTTCSGRPLSRNPTYSAFWSVLLWRRWRRRGVCLCIAGQGVTPRPLGVTPT